ncbi:MAG: hypothetical protein HKO00_08420 [Flavobacteriaceae bacterium]|nr:hypothetical protein [Flavobacteriaceae bacterium]
MEALIIHQEIEALAKQKKELFEFKNEGLLNSPYKQAIRENFFHSDPNSIFAIKQRIRSYQFQFPSTIDTILKLSVFSIVLAIALV